MSSMPWPDIPTDPIVTVPDLYLMVDELLEALHQASPEAREIEEQSSQIKRDLAVLVSSATPQLSPLASGDIALKALKLGMVSGVSDGLRLSQIGLWKESLPVEPDALPWATLWSNLEDVRDMAQTNWKSMEKGDLHLLWEYGRHQNLDTLVQASRYAGEDDPEPFQVFLLATFKAGYAVAVAQAVWRFSK